MNTLILVSRLHILHFLNTTTFHFLKNGSPFSYMTVLNVNVINTSIKKSKLFCIKISVLNYPTYITLTKLLDIRSNHTSTIAPNHTSKPLTVANQTEFPKLHYANIILNTTIDDTSRYFSVPFAVADIKYNIVGTPFFEDNIQNISIQDSTLEFKHQSKIQPKYTKFTTLLSKDYPCFSYSYRINSKTQIRLKPKSSKIAHFQ